jgi:hypothetical protein
VRGKAVNKFDNAVMLQHHALCQVDNGGVNIAGKSAQRKQQHVLLRLESRSARLGVTFAQKLANAITEFRQCTVLFRRDSCAHVPKCIAIRYIVPVALRSACYQLSET